MPRFVNPQPRYVDKNGKALVGGKLNFYDAGTVTRRNTYNSESFSTPNTNPVILDANGRPQVDIFLDGVYKVVLTDSNDQVIWEKDPVGGTTGVTALSDWIDDATYSVGDLVTGSDGLYYRSLTNGNIGLDPTQEADDWERVQFLREWRTTLVYQTDDIVIGSDDIVYQSLSDENQGNDPISDAVNWSSVKDYFGAANGVATLDADGLVPSDQIPPIAITDVYVVADQAARLALDAQVGDIAVQNDNNTAYILQSLPASTNSNWIEFGIQNFGSAAFRDVGTGLTEIPDNAQLNTRLGTTGNLGDAAQRNVGLSASNLMEVGAFDLGNSGTAFNITNLDTLATTRFGRVESGAVGLPPEFSVSGLVMHIQRANNSGLESVQYLVDRNNSFFIRVRRGDLGGWQNWINQFNELNQITLGTTSASARSVLELGTSATYDVGVDTDDIAQYGTMGLSGYGYGGLLASNEDADNTDFNTGFYVWNNNANPPLGVSGTWHIIHARRASGGGETELWLRENGTPELIVRNRITGGWNSNFVAIQGKDVSFLSIDCPDYDGSSDERLKRCINECVLSKKELSMIVPKMWVWANMDEVSDTIKGRADAGAIAQDLLKIPRLEPLIKKDENGFYKFDRGKIALIIAQSMAYHQYGKGSLWQRIKGLLF